MYVFNRTAQHPEDRASPDVNQNFRGFYCEDATWEWLQQHNAVKTAESCFIWLSGEDWGGWVPLDERSLQECKVAAPKRIYLLVLKEAAAAPTTGRSSSAREGAGPSKGHTTQDTGQSRQYTLEETIREVLKETVKETIKQYAAMEAELAEKARGREGYAGKSADADKNNTRAQGLRRRRSPASQSIPTCASMQQHKQQQRRRQRLVIALCSLLMKRKPKGNMHLTLSHFTPC